MGGRAWSMAMLAVTFAAGTLASIASSSNPYEGENATADAGNGEADASADAPPIETRKLTVEIDWPTVKSLDPAQDARAARLVVTVNDATAPARRATRELGAAERGPFEITVETGPSVDVTVEVLAADASPIGLGRRPAWDVGTNTTISVAVRRTLLYFTSGDRDNGQLRALDLSGTAPFRELLPSVDSLTDPARLFITPDGKELLQLGSERLDGDRVAPVIAGISTSSHVRVRTIALPFEPGVAASLDGMRKIVVFPLARAQATSIAVVDVEKGTTTTLPINITSGWLDLSSCAASPDGRRAIAVGRPQTTPNGTGAAIAVAFDAASGTARAIALPFADEVRGVGFTADGAKLVLLGFVKAGDGGVPGAATGRLLITSPETPEKPERTLLLTPNVTRSSGLILHPNGRHAYVMNETQYEVTPSCCGETRIIDLSDGAETYVSGSSVSGPEYQLSVALRLPWGPARVLAGQTDNGNNVHGSLVDITDGGVAPVPVMYSAPDIGTVMDMVTPFGGRL